MRAYLQLVRLPNVFTAMADILLGYLLTHRVVDHWPHLVLLLGASSAIYMAGMVLNDYFDREQDARERPFRPIPSGRVTPRTALVLGWSLLVAGTVLGAAATTVAGDPRPIAVAVTLAAAVFLYDGVVKQTPLAPLVMGLCRTLNVLLGMSLSLSPWSAPYMAVAVGIGLYIVGVTIFARTEAHESGRGQLALGLVVMLAGIALAASMPLWATGEEWPPIHSQASHYVLMAMLAFIIGQRCFWAVLDPRPALVQTAVKTCIFSLVIIDATASLAVQDVFWAVVILLLLIPTVTLGRWIYST